MVLTRVGKQAGTSLELERTQGSAGRRRPRHHAGADAGAAGAGNSGLTQAAFAERIATPVATLRDWEQGRFSPPGAVACLMRLIVNHPELAEELTA